MAGTGSWPCLPAIFTSIAFTLCPYAIAHTASQLCKNIPLSAAGTSLTARHNPPTILPAPAPAPLQLLHGSAQGQEGLIELSHHLTLSRRHPGRHASRGAWPHGWLCEWRWDPSWLD